MPLLPTELDSLREDVQTWYEERCNLYRNTNADDAYGGSEDTEALLKSDISCFIESTPGREQVQPFIGIIRAEHIFLVYLPPDEDVRTGDHLVVTTRDNLHLRVQAVLAPESLDIEQVVAASTLGEHE